MVNDRKKNVISLRDRALARDKNRAQRELTDYFLKKDRQIQGAQLISLMKRSLGKRILSTSEAKRLGGYLAKQFDIRRPDTQYYSPGFLSLSSRSGGQSRAKKQVSFTAGRKRERPGEFFSQLFIRLQNAVEERLLDHRGACVLVREIVEHYPMTRDVLKK